MHTAYLTAGLSWGDEGKGSVVSALVKRLGAKVVVRPSGGPQCAHNVVTDDGRHHTFSQFGSGTFHGAKTYYGRFALLEPYALFNEARALESKGVSKALEHFRVEEGALIITPFDWLSNRIRETARGTARHGSCGFGIGEAREGQLDNQVRLYARDLKFGKWQTIYEKLLEIRENKRAGLELEGMDASRLMQEDMFSLAYFYERRGSQINIVRNGALGDIVDGPVVFEGNQGILLDELHGLTPPHQTWTDCTFTSGLRLAREARLGVFKLGVLRTYATRHGAGPFVTEQDWMNFADHNTAGEFQGQFRFGYFDLVATRYALKVCGGLDGLALTHVDTFEDGQIPVVAKYTGDAWKVDKPDTDWMKAARPDRAIMYNKQDLAEDLNVPLMLESSGPRDSDKRITLECEAFA